MSALAPDERHREDGTAMQTHASSDTDRWCPFDVEVTNVPSDPSGVRSNIERPTAEDGDGRRITIAGWVVSEPPTVAIEVVDARGERVLRMPVATDRPDVDAAHPGGSGAPRYGFRGQLLAGTCGGVIELRLHAVARGTAGPAIGTITLSPRPAPHGDLVSVVIPCYDQAEYLGDAIESALDQSYPHVEVVVVDDGSRDNTRQVCASYPGVRFVLQANLGVCAARNAGLVASNGAYLVFLDADDRLVPIAASVGVEALRGRPEHGAAYGWYREVDVTGVPIPTPAFPPLDGSPYGALLRTNWTGQPATALYRRSTFERIGGYDESFSGAADYELNLRVVRAVPVRRNPTVVVEFRRHAESMSTDRVRMLRDVLRALDRQRPHVVADRQLRTAWRDGRRWWRSYYGDGVNRQASAPSLRRWRSTSPPSLTAAARHARDAVGRLGLAVAGRPR